MDFRAPVSVFEAPVYDFEAPVYIFAVPVQVSLALVQRSPWLIDEGALPPHIAERLCLSVTALSASPGLRLGRHEA